MSQRGLNPSRLPAKLVCCCAVIRNELRFIQLMCEGHNTKYQRMFYEQPSKWTGKTYCVLFAIVDYFVVLERFMDDFGLIDAVQCVETLVDLVQGPCAANQTALLETKLLTSLMSVMAWEITDCKVRHWSG